MIWGGGFTLQNSFLCRLFLACLGSSSALSRLFLPCLGSSMPLPGFFLDSSGPGLLGLSWALLGLAPPSSLRPCPRRPRLKHLRSHLDLGGRILAFEVAPWTFEIKPWAIEVAHWGALRADQQTPNHTRGRPGCVTRGASRGSLWPTRRPRVTEESLAV